MALRELAGGVTDAATVKRVFGQPIEKDGIAVIPVAAVRGGFGGGESDLRDKPEGAEPRPGRGWGGGGAFSAVPAGVYVIKSSAASPAHSSRAADRTHRSGDPASA
jgi:uncharacterized spore protein YtfJ